MARKLRITDNVHMQPVGIISDPAVLKDFISGGVTPLIVKIAATHSGLITGNNTFYLPDKMKKGTDTWISQYPKPVLAHHESNKDAVGRIVRAEYVDLAPDQVTLFSDSVIQNTLTHFKAGMLTKKGELAFIKDILIKSEVLKDKNYQGLGYIQLIAAITDPDAIQKIRDGRYLTGSVSASTDAAICSICESDWIIDSRCEHVPGEVYDEIPAFLIAGNFEYEEYSWVNRPADVHSKMLELVSDGKCERINNTKTNDYSKKFENYISMSDKITKDALKVNSHAARMMLISAHDSLHYQWDYKVVSYQQKSTLPTSNDPYIGTTPSDALPPKDIYDLHEQLHREAQEQEIDGSLILGALDSSLPEELWPPMPQYGSSQDSVKEKNVMPGTNMKDEVEKIDEVSATAVTSEEVGNAKLTKFSDAAIEDLENKFNEIDLNTETLTDDQVEIVYELMARELEDAKLTTKKRKALAATTFCGPDRSYPVPDRAHAINALARAKQHASPALQARIRACVCRKFPGLPSCTRKEDALEVNDTGEWTEELKKEATEKENLIIVSTDALTAQQRKALPESAFCGPGRSFPVPDCDHVFAARRLIGRYKGPGDKGRILVCVARKAKALGCDSEEDSMSAEPLKDDVSAKQGECDPCKETLAKAEAITRDAVARKDQEIQKLGDQLAALREEFRYLYQDFATLEDELVAGKEELRKFKATRAVDIKRLSGIEVKDVNTEVASLMKLDDKQLDAQVVSIDIDKFIVKLNSGLANINPEATVANPSAPATDSALSEDEMHTAKVVQETYNHLLSTAGPKKAENYLTRMKREGYIKD